MDKKVMIGCPVRNRAWILSRYLEHLKRLKFPMRKIEYCFVINDCVDETPDILETFADEQSSPVKLIRIDFGHNQGHERGEYSFFRLAKLRNLLLKGFLDSDCDYLFSVDSDILIPPSALRCLLDDDCDIVSALVCNGHELRNKKIFNILNRENGKWMHLLEFPRDQIFQVDCTGAAYLIKRRVIERYEVRYSASLGAEDIGFCQSACSKGIKIFCDGRIECTHVMKEDDIKKSTI